MKPGPAPKPTRLKVLAGTCRRDRGSPNEPTPALACPPPPRRLSAEAAVFWAELVSVLAAMRVLTVADVVALELLAEALGEWDRARQQVAAEGATQLVETKSGRVLMPHPGVRMGADAWRRAERMLTQFGLSPSSRTRVSAIPEGRESANPFGSLDSGTVRQRFFGRRGRV